MKISQALTLPCGVVLKNRIAKSAMSENMAVNHKPKQAFQNLYHTWAKGGSGLLISGNIMIDSQALGEANNVIVEKNAPDCREELRAWAKHTNINGCALWAQLNHPGKQSPKMLSPQPVAPSALAYPSPMNKLFAPPRELKESEILDIISRFSFAAKTLKESGFQGIQIHGAHGYLVSQFLSPHHNQRKDDWGGSLANRMRFPLEVYRAIRKEVGEKYPVGIKLNSADFQKGGFSEEDSLEVAKCLSREGMDIVEISGGTYESAAMMGKKQKKSTLKREAYFLDYCEKIAKNIDAPLMLTGGFRSSAGMEAALESGACQLIGLGRSLAIDPNFPKKLLAGEDCKSLVHPLTTGFKKLDRLLPLEITWYTQQLQRMGSGHPPKPNANVKLSLLKTFVSYGVQGFARNRV